METTTLFVVLGISAVISVMLAIRSTKKSRGLQRYEKVTDALALRKIKKKKLVKKDNQEPEYEPRGFSLANLIGGFIVILVGISILPEVARQVELAQRMSPELSIAGTGILELTTLFFALAIGISAIAIIGNSLVNAGLISPGILSSNKDEYEEVDTTKADGIHRYEGVTEALSTRDEE